MLLNSGFFYERISIKTKIFNFEQTDLSRNTLISGGLPCLTSLAFHVSNNCAVRRGQWANAKEHP
jgi:hypothetical protein